MDVVAVAQETETFEEEEQLGVSEHQTKADKMGKQTKRLSYGKVMADIV